jgi:hypothetical protein
MTDETEPDLFDIPRASGKTDIAPATFRHWIHMGTECGPKFKKYGRRRMIRRIDLEAWIAGKVGGAA